ncbi:MAG: GIY-YIG nuclease family protein [Pseudomonadota bacterium]|nr:GIY-YIG nuclease family protein [Pseudomonadota bacterium]
MAREFTDADDDLLAELGEDVEAEEASTYTPRQERIIAGFEDIQRFVAEHGRTPRHDPEGDIFERLYAVRLDRLRALPECRELLAAFDPDGLLGGPPAGDAGTEDEALEELDDDALLSALGDEEDEAGADLTTLRHVRSAEEKRQPDTVAERTRCADFDRFRPLFETVRAELKDGTRQTRPFGGMAEIEKGRFFILGGQIAYVAERGEDFVPGHGNRDARLRVIYDNGTESDLLKRSLQRALTQDEAGRRITEPEAGPLFGDSMEDGETAVGTIYVARSLSDHPFVAEHRTSLYKIGVTTGDPHMRVSGAAKDPTFLLAPAELVAEYTLHDIHPRRLEQLMHRIFAPARIDLSLEDRFGAHVSPREWFLVPITAIEEAIAAIRDGTVTGRYYDPKQGRLLVS